ncbi:MULTISPECIES: UDP-N-acetylmuramate dehydrogenase [unclassified Neisseria]|uniref:UDP-N-acetylmuramate dehydrogenase n=1 Tax=unclassified Neisseria TaxID=2623750 RepID=UPI00142FE970|nr:MULTISPECIES: UDP-N-acetylmuramate dehydrogenase [unclassified Neisseria]MBF0804281.1 UDP-N-acetylmuramate dehydrogenase [Neisseria sp. 19428wB4_WF04]
MQVMHNVDLTPLNTFGLKARARDFAVLEHENDLHEIVKLPAFKRESVLWLGGGSNILLMGDYQGLAVHIQNRGIRELFRSDGLVYLEAQAGEVWHEFVLHTLEAGLSGLENLSLIPGSVGASPVQNIGAYGVEVKDAIHSVRCFDLDTCTFVTLDNAACRFSYRESLFKQAGRGRYVITAVVFALNETFRPNVRYGDLAAVVEQACAGRKITAKDVSDAVCQIRSGKLPDPKTLGNVGSFFKNPVVAAPTAQKLLAQYPDMPHYPQPDGSVKLAAGWLIERCNLKGFQIGGAAVHNQQALVLVNKQQAQAHDVYALAQHIVRTVQQTFGVALHTEPNWIGADTAPDTAAAV